MEGVRDASASDLAAPPCSISSIRVTHDRLVCLVHVLPGFRYTNPTIADMACREFPHLRRHTCVNSSGATFGDVIERTSMPHLLEHVTIDELVDSSRSMQAKDSHPFTFAGTTEWVDESNGIACVRIRFRDDIEALRALTVATGRINVWCSEALKSRPIQGESH